MTLTIKQFAALEDIAALRVECTNCKASLSVPMSASTFNLPNTCPSYGADWYESSGNGRSVGDIMASLAQQMRLLRRAMESKMWVSASPLMWRLAVRPSSPLLPAEMFS